MRVSAEIRYDADPTTVMVMLADPAFQRRKCEATGALSHSVDVQGDPATGPVTITTRRTMPTDDIPDFVRRFVGNSLELTQTDSWDAAAPDGSRAGTVVVEISGAPVRLRGEQEMTGRDGGTHQRVEGDLKASVPLVGGKVERAAEPAMRAAIRKEEEVGTAWLAGR